MTAKPMNQVVGDENPGQSPVSDQNKAPRPTRTQDKPGSPEQKLKDEVQQEIELPLKGSA